MTEEMPVRGQNGRFVKTVEVAEKDSKAALLRSRGLGFAEIAQKLGYADEGGAYKAYRRALAAIPVQAVDELRATEVQKLDALERLMWAVVQRRHYVAQHGRVVVDPETGEPMIDPGPAMTATEKLLKIAERRARLLGLDAPTKIEARNVSALDAEIEELLARLSGRLEIEPDARE